MLLCFLLGSQNSTETLGFLQSGTVMRGDLDDHIGCGQVDCRVTDLTDKDCIDDIVLLEMVEDVHAFELCCLTIDEWLAEFLGEVLLGEQLIREDDDFVATRLVQVDQILTSDELVWIADVEHLLLVLVACEVLLIELGSHLTPHFNALYVCEVALFCEIFPVRLVELGSNKEVKIHDGLCVFFDESSSET